ncbi:MAG: HAMP domain-containing histidine kinase [Clostridia bacterium]|nr:HAMP domain-containing histidine kinase [Clostridia bacterium]
MKSKTSKPKNKTVKKKKELTSIVTKVIMDFFRYNFICLCAIVVCYIIAYLYFRLNTESFNLLFDFVKGLTNKDIARFITGNSYILIPASFLIVFVFNCFLFSVTTLINFNKTYKSLNAFLDTGTNIVSFSKSYSDVELKLKDIQLDIIESKHLASQLESKKNDLVMYLAHDLKTPLTSVIGYLTLLEECPELTQSQRAKFTGIALDKAYRLEQLITEFFEITRFNINTVQLQKNRIDLGMMMEQIADEFYPMLSEKDLQIDVDIPEKILMYADSDKLARVIDNLLKNAVNYSYEGSTILVGSRVRNGRVIIKFRNQCDEIPREKLEKIFDKFYRMDTSRSSETGGSGLGLAIAKQIVELHGGTIRASSNTDYTDFTVVLPFISAETLTEKQLEF